MNEKLLSALSMARGAGKLKIGHDAAMEAVNAGAPLVVITSDASQRTTRSVERFCDGMCELIKIQETQSDIEEKFGRRFAVAAVTDPGFTRLVKKNLTDEQEEAI